MRDRTFWVLGLLSLLPACSSVEPTVNVRGLEPCSLTLAVDVPELPAPAVDGELRFAASPNEVRDMLITSLQAMNTASRVIPFAPGSGTAPAAAASGGNVPAPYDAVLHLSFAGPIAMNHEGTANPVAAGGLWLVSWIGGLVVQDSAYNVALDARCRVHLRDRHIDRSLGSQVVNLSFLERNDFFSWSTLQSLVLPPFWTSDQSATTSAALTRRSVDALARDLAAFLKQDFEPQALETDFCRIALLGAKNGSAVPGPAMPIEFEIISNAAVTGIEVAVNEGPPRPVQPATARQVEFRHRVTVPVQLTGLHEDRDNYVRIRIDAGDTFYRTLRFGPRAN